MSIILAAGCYLQCFDVQFKVMTKEDIVGKTKELALHEGSYVVFGSCPLAVAGIREANDVDMLVSEEVFAQLQETGWEIEYKGTGDNPLVKGVFDIHKSWDFSSYSPTLEQLLATATIVDGVPIASLDEVRKWKVASGRPKDLVDIELIDNYLAANNS